VLIALAEEAERGRRTEVAEELCEVLRPAFAAVVLGGLAVGVETQHRGSEAGVDRHAGAGERARRRAAADVYGLAKVELERELIRGGLRPERIARPRHRR
jgi:hypothetical protein